MRNSFVESVVRCVVCGERVADSVVFAWGLCGPAGNLAFRYNVGDTVRWRANTGQAPLAFTKFEGPLDMVNHGDPAIHDAWVVDGLTVDQGHFCECSSCGAEVVVVVQVLDGVVQQTMALPMGDRRVVEGFDLMRRLDQTQYEVVEWDHGVTSAELEEVSEWLNLRGHLVDIPGVGSDGISGEWIAALTQRQEAIRQALLDGNRKFPREILCHAIADIVGSDAEVLDYYLEQLLQN